MCIQCDKRDFDAGKDTKSGAAAGPGPDPKRKRPLKTKSNKPLTKSKIGGIMKGNPVISKSVMRRIKAQTKMSYPNPIGFQY